MAKHVNQQVREKVAAKLGGVTGLEAVFTNRGANLTDADLPAAMVLTSTDEVETASKTKGVEPLEKRTIRTDVVLVASGSAEGVDDDLDALRLGVEQEMSTDDDLDGLAHRVTHTGAELDIGTDEDGENWYAFLVLSYEIEAWTERGTPETAI